MGEGIFGRPQASIWMMPEYKLFLFFMIHVP